MVADEGPPHPALDPSAFSANANSRMWTHSHFLLTAFAVERLGRRRPVAVGPALAGAVAPDVPLVVLTLGYAALRRLTGVARPGEGLYGPGFDELFFRNPLWVTLHNGLHAPLVLLALAWIGWRAWRRHRHWGLDLCWFVAGCAFHTALDVATHTHDGPLVLFPVSWTYRVASPVSYWHPAHFGRTASWIEAAVDLAIVIYFARWWRYRDADGAQPVTPGRQLDATGMWHDRHVGVRVRSRSRAGE